MVDHITGNTTFKTIEIIVSSTGKTRLETKGFAGPECRAASKFLEQALGKTSDERVTGAFYQASSEQQRHQQHS